MTHKDKQTIVKANLLSKLKQRTDSRIARNGIITQTQIDKWKEEEKLKEEQKKAKQHG